MCYVSIRIILLLLFPILLQAVPDPQELSSSWWDYFNVPSESLEKKVSEFDSALDKLPPNLSKEGQEKALELIKEIKTNLSLYTSMVLLPKEVFAQAPSPQSDYSIEELLQLNQEFRNSKNSESSKIEERDRILKQKDSLQERQDKLIVAYGQEEAKSEQRYLVGLERILYRSSIELAKKKIERLNHAIVVQNETSKALADALQSAQKALKVTAQEQAHVEKSIPVAKADWQKAEERLKSKEAAIEGVNKTEFEQEVLSNELNAALLKTKYLELLVQGSLAEGRADHILEWKEQIEAIKESFSGWRESAQKALQFSGQTLKNDAAIKTAQENLLLIEELKGATEEASFLVDTFSTLSGVPKFWIDYKAAADSVGEIFTKTLFYIGQQPVTLLGVLRFIFILLAAYIISRVAVRALDQFAQSRKGVRKDVIYRVNRLVQYLIFTIGFILGLTFLGFDLSNLILLASALGVGIGFGLQSIFNNFLSGIIILFQSQLKVGDYIELESGMRGEIREINVRSCILLTNDGLEVLIPNSELLNTKVINWTLRDPYRRLKIPFSVAYGTNIDRMKDLVIEAAKKVPHTLIKVGIPEPSVFLQKFGESSIDFELFVWVNERSTRRMSRTKSAYLWAIHDLFRDEGIEVPFPQRELHFNEKTKI